jgi:hypothetical protein
MSVTLDYTSALFMCVGGLEKVKLVMKEATLVTINTNEAIVAPIVRSDV